MLQNFTHALKGIDDSFLQSAMGKEKNFETWRIRGGQFLLAVQFQRD